MGTRTLTKSEVEVELLDKGTKTFFKINEHVYWFNTSFMTRDCNCSEGNLSSKSSASDLKVLY